MALSQLVAVDVGKTLDQQPNLKWDFFSKFGPDLRFKLGSIKGLLDELQVIINDDAELHLAKKFRWSDIKSPRPDISFAEALLELTPTDLVGAVTKALVVTGEADV